MIVVTTPTGHIGSQVAQQLLAAGEAVRVLVRDPSKLSEEIHDQAEVVQGSSDDERVLVQAFEGAERLLWIVPPAIKTHGHLEQYLQFTRPACRAIVRQGVKRVVGVSALGRGVAFQAGPVTASLAKDTEIEQTGVEYRALWCPSFMENLLGQLEQIRHQGLFFVPGRSDLKSRHVATRDIASRAVQLLLDRSWTGQGGVAVLGPEDLSFDDMAAIMTEVLARPVRVQQLSLESYKAHLLEVGMDKTFAQGLVDMYAAKAAGLDNAEPRTAENTTPTTFRQWCEDVLKPAVQR